jgi:hypothetical protein
MILQRLMAAIREQNWFAVVLELLIVILGIVIGFQVTAWNEDRTARANETQIIERLHSEIIGLGNSRWDWAADRLETRANLLALSHVLYGDGREDVATEISAAGCVAIAQSHVFNSPSLALPVITELESTGDLDLITNRAVRQAITNYLMANAWARELDTAINHEVFNLTADYPTLFHFVPPTEGLDWNPIFDGSVRCDSAAMRTDQAFLNALADNISKSLYFMTGVLDAPNASFTALHAIVDAELGLTHDDGAE